MDIRLALLSILLSFSLQAQAPSPAAVDIEFLLDASGSMETLIVDRTQMDVAKQALKETLSIIPPEVPVALRVYGHRISKTDKTASCKDSELVVPFGPLNRANFSLLVDYLQPSGYSPIDFSLREAAKDFSGKEAHHIIILINDGEEACGGDPADAAKSLLAQGFKVTIHTVGLRADETTKAQLTAIAEAGGGLYFDAPDAASLAQNVRAATQKALLADREPEKARGIEIHGGKQYEDAVPLQAGVEYRLDHHQGKDRYDYFYVDLKKGKKLTVTIGTQETGVTIVKEEVTENQTPYAGFRIVDTGFKELGDYAIIGSRHGRQEQSIMALQEGRFYILIGNKYEAQHRNSPFEIGITDLEIAPPPAQPPAPPPAEIVPAPVLPPAPKESPSFHTWTYALLGAAFLVIIALLAWIIVLLKRIRK